LAAGDIKQNKRLRYSVIISSIKPVHQGPGISRLLVVWGFRNGNHIIVTVMPNMAYQYRTRNRLGAQRCCW
jgi:hypothetical protein